MNKNIKYMATSLEVLKRMVEDVFEPNHPEETEIIYFIVNGYFVIYEDDIK